MQRVDLGKTIIGDGLPPLMIAEIGLNHNGNLDFAHQLIDLAYQSGAHAVKFQKRSPADLAVASYIDQPFLKCPLFGKTQREIRNKLELNLEELQELKDHAEELGLIFFISVFDSPSLKIACDLGVDIIKVASHSITNYPLLEEIADTGKALIVSMGASTWEERDDAYGIVKKNPLILMHCVSAYPCPDNLLKLETIPELAKRYNAVVGYSGHEVDLEPSVLAVALGAKVIERHFTFSRAMVGLDHKISLEPDEFAELSLRVSRVNNMFGVVDGIMEDEKRTRNNYHVAACSKYDLEAGKVITLDDICFKQPVVDESKYFMPKRAIKELIGKKLKTSIKADIHISINDIK